MTAYDDLGERGEGRVKKEQSNAAFRARTSVPCPMARLPCASGRLTVMRTLTEYTTAASSIHCYRSPEEPVKYANFLSNSPLDCHLAFANAVRVLLNSLAIPEGQLVGRKRKEKKTRQSYSASEK